MLRILAIPNFDRHQSARRVIRVAFLLAPGLFTACSFRYAEFPVRAQFPPGVDAPLTSVLIESSDSENECAERLRSLVSQLLSSRGVPAYDSWPSDRDPSSALPVILTIRVDVCGEDGSPAPLRDPGERRAMSQDTHNTYPGRSISPPIITPGNQFRLGAAVEVNEAETGLDVGRLDLSLAPFVHGTQGDGNFVGNPPSKQKAAAATFALAKHELERFLFPWSEDYRLSHYALEDCQGETQPDWLDVGQLDLALRRAMTSLESCRGRVANEDPRALSVALYNVGFVHLLRNDASSALVFLERASRLANRNLQILEATAVARGIAASGAVVLPTVAN